MRILVTGADGFTGKHFCSRASEAGYDVYKLNSNVLDREALQSEVLLAKPDFVVHLAAVSFIGTPDKAGFYAVNVIGTTNLLDAILELPKSPVKVLIASSANVYGNSEIPLIDETVATNPINHYAMSKVAMENMALTYADKIPIIITRPFNYTGCGQSKNFIIPKLVYHFVNRKESISLGNIEVEREFNSVEMVCDSYLALLKYGAEGEIFNICSGVVYSLKSVIESLSKATGHSLTIERNRDLVRVNEVFTLRGNPKKLHFLLKKNSVVIEEKTLEATMLSMMG